MSKRAGRPLSLRTAWATPGGTATKPLEDGRRLAFAADLEGQLALEDVGVGVLVVNVQAGDLLASGVSRLGDH